MDRICLPPSQAHALEVMDHLAAGKRVVTRPDPAAPVDTLEPELLSLGMQRLARHCLQFLVRAGGYRERSLLRGGRRVRARLWDPDGDDDFRLQFTAASLELWTLMLHPLQPPRRGQIKGLSARRIRTQISCHRGPRLGGTGDWLFVALARAHLAEGRLLGQRSDEFVAVLETELGRLSPLAALGALRPTAPGGLRPEAWLGRLLSPDRVKLVECLDDVLAGWWTGRVEAALELGPLEVRTARLAAMAGVRCTRLATPCSPSWWSTPLPPSASPSPPTARTPSATS